MIPGNASGIVMVHWQEETTNVSAADLFLYDNGSQNAWDINLQARADMFAAI